MALRKESDTTGFSRVEFQFQPTKPNSNTYSSPERCTVKEPTLAKKLKLHAAEAGGVLPAIN
jgi:hypothetical protein